jgi:radical SAM superfamily enzyme YgiQ (UPF0313 family)/protein-L-isoaspartate O-methyltransferase
MSSGLRTPGVLLVSPGIIKWTDMDFGLPHLVSMGGWLRETTGVRVELLDLNYEGGDHAHLRRTIESLGPHLVIGLSCYSSFDYMRVMALARFIRRVYPDVPLVAGGYHASALPDDIVFDGSPFDAVIVGEGERPMQAVVEDLLGSGRLSKTKYGPDQIEDLDTLPPYAWELLARYWPRAKDIGRKFQIYLARGCPYHCTFCMERAKSGYKWRAYSADRAVDELRRLSTFTDLSHWVINVADPLFGFRRSWRRQVLEGIIKHDLLPRQYWTLTRSDDLDDVDVSLLARARFSIGIGLESGSPQMLVTMQKGNKPDAYLAAMKRLATLSRKHGLNWASNVIVGHPGETMESMRQTREYLGELFTSAADTCGWLSIDPFRLYPGAQVHEAMDVWTRLHGTKFHHPKWWHTWYDASFRAEHIDPSHEVDFEARVRFMYEAYPPLVTQIAERFRGQGRSVDRVFARSLAEQARLMSPATRDRILAWSRRVRSLDATEAPQRLRFPIGLHVRDEWIRRREGAVRRLLDDGVLRTDDLIEALLQVAPQRYMSEDDALSVLGDEIPSTDDEWTLPAALPLRHVAIGLEALEPALGDAVADVTARSGWVAAVLAQLVGEHGRVLAVHPESEATEAFLRSLEPHANVEVIVTDPFELLDLEGTFHGVWIGAALPRPPTDLIEHLVEPDGRAITFVGPRFRPQDLVALTRRDGQLHERRVARLFAPPLCGRGGWFSRPAPPVRAKTAT